MKISKTKIPPLISHCLWSYDISSIDIKRDSELIITQVLNYGDWEGVVWLWRTYSKKAIREVVLHPRRGLWFAQVLNFWELMLNIKLPRLVKDRAIFRLDPKNKIRVPPGRE